MKIGIDCRLWNESGIGRYTKNLVEQLLIIDKKNKYILFVLSKDHDQIISHFSSLNFHLVKTDIKWHTIDEQLKFPQILNKENLDLMHFPYFSVPIFYNRPFVVTIHDLIVNHFPTGQASTLALPIYNLKLLAYKFVLAQAAKKAKKIIAVSSATKNEIIDHLKVDGEKIVVTYEGVESSKFKVQSSKLQLKVKNYFLYVGNAYPHKNLEKLIEAFEKIKYQKSNIKNSIQNLKLVFVGKEDYFYKRLKKKVEKLKLSKKVIFLQNISDEELSNLYKNARALILPSLMEGFGLPVLEAMANKCLVLASDIPALREICGDAAIYFDPYNIKDIEEKMGEVCFNDLNHFSQKMQMGLERVKLFSWEKMAKETLAIYNSLGL